MNTRKMLGAIFLWLIVIPIVIVLIIFGILLFVTDTVRADPETGDMTTAQKCRALRQLDAEYRGAALSVAEKAIKTQMVAWYRVNCIRRKAKWK